MLAHRMVGELVADGHRQLTPSFLIGFVGSHPLLKNGNAVVYRQATRQRLCSAVAVYFRYFAPPADWQHHATELTTADGCRFDLTWLLPDGRYVIDEIKAGRPASAAERHGDQQQLDRYLAAGALMWGEHFGGVRLLMLGAPRDSAWVAAGGQREVIV